MLIGFGLSLWYDRKRKRDEEEADKIKVMRTIRDELRINLDYIKMGEKTNVIQAKIVTLSTVAMDSAVHSGKLLLLDAELQTKLADMYRKFKYAETFSNKILDMEGSADMAMSNAQQTLNEFQEHLFGIERALTDGIPGLIKILEQKLKATSMSHGHQKRE